MVSSQLAPWLRRLGAVALSVLMLATWDLVTRPSEGVSAPSIEVFQDPAGDAEHEVFDIVSYWHSVPPRGSSAVHGVRLASAPADPDWSRSGVQITFSFDADSDGMVDVTGRTIFRSSDVVVQMSETREELPVRRPDAQTLEFDLSPSVLGLSDQNGYIWSVSLLRDMPFIHCPSPAPSPTPGSSPQPTPSPTMPCVAGHDYSFDNTERVTKPDRPPTTVGSETTTTARFRRGVVRGRIGGEEAACRAARTVTVRWAGGAGPERARTRSDGEGRWRVRVERARRYRVVVRGDTAPGQEGTTFLCSRAERVIRRG